MCFCSPADTTASINNCQGSFASEVDNTDSQGNSNAIYEDVAEHIPNLKGDPKCILTQCPAYECHGLVSTEHKAKNIAL